jgi:hypothetical protein
MYSIIGVLVVVIVIVVLVVLYICSGGDSRGGSNRGCVSDSIFKCTHGKREYVVGLVVEVVLKLLVVIFLEDVGVGICVNWWW